VIGALLLGGYTVLWFIGAGVMRDEIAKFVANEEANGNQVTYENMKIRGFPIALRAQIDDFTWADPGEWDWSGETLHIIAMPHDVETLVFAPRGPQAVMTQGEYLSVTPGDLKVSISEAAYGAEGSEVLVERPDGAQLALGSLKANWSTDEPGKWVLGSVLRGVQYTDSDGRQAILPGVNIVLSHEPGQGENVTIDAAEIAFSDGTDGPPTLLKVKGDVGVDGRDYPAGNLNVTYRDEQKLLSLLRSFEVASEADLLQAEGVLKAYRAGKTEALVPFAMQDGKLYISGVARVAIGDLPKVR
ncbi:MAG: DUF2125 domain-containing protein, partial [Pseudomonadota bacterium]